MVVTVLVGGFSKTIEVFELQLNTDTKSTTMVHKESIQCDENPAFLEVVDNHVYAVHEVTCNSFITEAVMKVKRKKWTDVFLI